MAESFCDNCRKEFHYDEKSGVNVKPFEAEATRTYFRAGGLFPVCPACDSRCRTEEAIHYDRTHVKLTVRRMRLPFDLK